MADDLQESWDCIHKAPKPQKTGVNTGVQFSTCCVSNLPILAFLKLV